MKRYYEELPEKYVLWGKKPSRISEITIYAIMIPLCLYLTIAEPFQFMFLAVGVLLNIPLSNIHEACHKLGFRIFAGCNTATVVPMKGLSNPHCIAEGYFRKREIAFTLLMPLAIINTVLLLIIVVTDGFIQALITGCFMAHLLGCLADIIDFIWVILQPTGTLFSVPGTMIAYRIKSVNPITTKKDKDEQETYSTSETDSKI